MIGLANFSLLASISHSKLENHSSFFFVNFILSSVSFWIILSRVLIRVSHVFVELVGVAMRKEIFDGCKMKRAGLQMYSSQRKKEQCELFRFI